MVFAGNRFGKSTAGAVELLWRALGRHPFVKCPVPIKALIVATDFENHVKNVIEPKIIQWAPPGTITKIDRNQQGAARRFTFSSGSICDVLSQDQDLKVFESSDYDLCWFDEPVKQQIFNAVWRGLTDRGGYAYLTGTPLTEPWLFQEFQKTLEDKDDGIRWAIFGKTEDNATNLGEGNKEVGLKRIAQLAEMFDPEERAARLEGQFLQMHGLIFKGWKKSHHLIAPFPWPQHWPIYESIDPHPRKPWAVTWVGVTEDNTKILLKSGSFDGVIDEVADQIVLMRTNLGIDQDKKPRIIRTIIDNYASAPLMSRSYTDPTSRRKAIREELEDLIGPKGAGGPRVEVAPKNVAQKIDIFKRWLLIKDNRSEFYVFNHPENDDFVYEIENYVWDAKRGSIRNGLKDQPRKIDDDLLDSVMQVGLTLPKDTNTLNTVTSIRGLGTYSI
jgi:hypothetical protein